MSGLKSRTALQMGCGSCCLRHDPNATVLIRGPCICVLLSSCKGAVSTAPALAVKAHAARNTAAVDASCGSDPIAARRRCRSIFYPACAAAASSCMAPYI
eukprot:6198049-Pleurochrysis_carterae.AAC.4